MNTTKVSFSIQEDLLNSLDALAGEVGTSRTALIMAAIREHLRRRKAAEVRHQIAQAYSDSPDAAEKRQLVGMKGKIRKIASRDEW
jgi:metal-responsive CopG/Arc/MetJ family transcriptional regulator